MHNLSSVYYRSLSLSLSVSLSLSIVVVVVVIVTVCSSAYNVNISDHSVNRPHRGTERQGGSEPKLHKLVEIVVKLESTFKNKIATNIYPKRESQYFF